MATKVLTPFLRNNAAASTTTATNNNKNPHKIEKAAIKKITALEVDERSQYLSVHQLLPKLIRLHSVSYQNESRENILKRKETRVRQNRSLEATTKAKPKLASLKEQIKDNKSKKETALQITTEQHYVANQNLHTWKWGIAATTEEELRPALTGC